MIIDISRSTNVYIYKYVHGAVYGFRQVNHMYGNLIPPSILSPFILSVLWKINHMDGNFIPPALVCPFIFFGNFLFRFVPLAFLVIIHFLLLFTIDPLLIYILKQKDILFKFRLISQVNLMHHTFHMLDLQPMHSTVRTLPL